MYKALDLTGIDPIRLRGVRQALGVQAFGMNEFELPPGGISKKHDETATGQEEVYVILGGHGEMTIDDATMVLRADRYVRVLPGSVRQLRAGEDGLRYLCVGASPGGYEPSLGEPGLHEPDRTGGCTELGATEVPAVLVRRVRHALGVSAFGVTHFHLPPHVWHKRHDEVATAQEELYLVLDGDGVMTVDEDAVELRPGRYVLVQPDAVRQIQAGERGIGFVCFGAPAGRGYEPPW